MMFLLLFLCWWGCGVCGFAWHETRPEADGISVVPVGLVVGLLLGPFTWPAGFLIYEGRR